MSSPTVLVVGGGVAGAACAIQLRAHGVNVTVAEKTIFPRSKVCGCCIGGSGIETLGKLGRLEPTIDGQYSPVFHRIMSSAVQVNQWRGSIGGRTVHVELPSGIAISRETLDNALLDEAKEAGCEVHMACLATITNVAKDTIAVSMERSTGKQEQLFDLVIMASGLNTSGVATTLPWTESPHGPFGVSWTATCNELDSHVIHMACDDDGYVGLVRIENGRVDIAAALRSGSEASQQGTPADRVMKILARSEFPAYRWESPSKVLTTPPLRRARVAGAGRLMAIGDASGYVEPFTGEGMTWGMQSGIAAANRIGRAIQAGSVDDLSHTGHRWDRELRGLLRRKKFTCRVIANLLRSRLARKTVGSTLATFPKIANPLIRHLSQR